MQPKKLSPQIQESIMSRMRELAPWFHNIEIAEGVYTNPGSEYPLNRWQILEPFLPQSLEGKACLDVGCSSGFFSIELRKRGASKVIGIDDGEQARAVEQAKFAAGVLEMDCIDFRKHSVYDVDKLGVKFDYTLFLGVLYHLRHPLLALDKLRQVTKGTLIMQTVTAKIEDTTKIEEDYFKRPESFSDIPLRSPLYYELGYPKLYFIENMMEGDFTNRWLPNVEGLMAMLRSSGFKIERVYIMDHEVFVICS